MLQSLLSIGHQSFINEKKLKLDCIFFECFLMFEKLNIMQAQVRGS